MNKKITLYTILLISILTNIALVWIYKTEIFSGSKRYLHYLTDRSVQQTRFKINYHDALDFEVKGRYHTERSYNRLPVNFKGIVRDQVWNLSNNSAGIKIRFKSNAHIITVKWELSSNTNLSNISRLGTSGLDMYFNDSGVWRYINSAIPTGKKNESTLISNMDGEYRTYEINLPLYDGLESLQIGIDEGRTIAKTSERLDSIAKPIVFYGTSITQGGSASRPGMVYPSIISRDLKCETINLGFSANGKFEQAIGKAMCEIDASAYVIDCVPNSDPQTIEQNAFKLVKQLRLCHSHTPIILVESIIRESSYLNTASIEDNESLNYIVAQNRALMRCYDEVKKAGMTGVYYVKADSLIGHDHEATVDGTHLSDIGHQRMALALEPVIKRAISIAL